MNLEMIHVTGGTFQMGGTKDQYEKPVHAVTLSDFQISKYQITQEMYQQVMGSNPSPLKSSNLPAEHVNWFEAIEFCNRLSRFNGLRECYIKRGHDDIYCEFNADGFRLPTEAEWEYAARGGNQSKGYEYSGSNILSEVAWYSENSNGQAQPVGLKKPNELGIYDMSGNVPEWCWDLYANYKMEHQVNPVGSDSGMYQILRGGSWSQDAIRQRVAFRTAISPDMTCSVPLHLINQRTYGFGKYQSGSGFRISRSV